MRTTTSCLRKLRQLHAWRRVPMADGVATSASRPRVLASGLGRRSRPGDGEEAETGRVFAHSAHSSLVRLRLIRGIGDAPDETFYCHWLYVRATSTTDVPSKTPTRLAGSPVGPRIGRQPDIKKARLPNVPFRQRPHDYQHPLMPHSCDGCWCKGENDRIDYGWGHHTSVPQASDRDSLADAGGTPG